jgi:hypothetical protein
VFEAFEAMERRGWLHRDQAHRRAPLAQTPARPDERAARAEAGDEMGEAFIRLLDDLGARRLVVRAPVRRVVVLVRVEIAIGVGVVNPARLADGAVAAFHRIGQHHLGAVGAQQSRSFGRHVARQAEAHAIARAGGEHGVGNAGVAGRGVEQHPARYEGAAPLAVEHHGQRRAVLHRSAGIRRLELGVQLDTRLRLEAAQPDERRAPDERGNRRVRQRDGRGWCRHNKKARGRLVPIHGLEKPCRK